MKRMVSAIALSLLMSMLFIAGASMSLAYSCPAGDKPCNKTCPSGTPTCAWDKDGNYCNCS